MTFKFGGGSGGGGGALTLIGRTIAVGGETALAVSAIPDTFKDLIFAVSGNVSGGTGELLQAQFNSDAGTNYDQWAIFNGGSNHNTLSYLYAGSTIGSGTPTDLCGGEFTLYNYASASFWKSFSGTVRDSANIYTVLGKWENVAPITDIEVSIPAGALVAGSVLSVYGRG